MYDGDKDTFIFTSDECNEDICRTRQSFGIAQADVVSRDNSSGTVIINCIVRFINPPHKDITVTCNGEEHNETVSGMPSSDTAQK